jgi:hypothetical protein
MPPQGSDIGAQVRYIPQPIINVTETSIALLLIAQIRKGLPVDRMNGTDLPE